MKVLVGFVEGQGKACFVCVWGGGGEAEKGGAEGDSRE